MPEQAPPDDAIRSMPVLVVGPAVGPLAELLRSHGFSAVTAVSDPVAVPALLADLIVADLDVTPAADLLGTLRDRGSGPPALAVARDADTARRLRAAGARDVIGDPTDADEVITRVRTTLQNRMLEQMLSDASAVLSESEHERTRQLDEARGEVLERLVVAAEFRNEDTRDHTRRVGETSALLAGAAGLAAADVEIIRLAAPLHDVGKIGVSDALLLKPGALADDEFAIMRLHPVIGARILWGSHAPVLKTAGEIALFHHEHWDGTGYPTGFAGENIPVSARLAAVADVFDALTHARPYKEAWPIERALKELRALAGTQLDPRLAALFEKIVSSGELEKIGWS